MKGRIADAVATMQRIAGPSIHVAASSGGRVATFTLSRFGGEGEMDRDAVFTMPTAIRHGSGAWLTTLHQKFLRALQVLA